MGTVVRKLGAVIAMAGAWMVGSGGVTSANAQQATISGTVTDQVSGDGLAGARVIVIGTNRSLTTDQDGRYTIRNAPVGAVRLRVIQVGYAPVEITTTVSPGGSAELNVALTAAVYTLEEIVTTATGEQSRRELGNVVAKLDAAAITEEQPVTNFQDLLNSRAPGVAVYQGQGTAGTGARIRIRGVSSASLANDPIVYIDGVRVESSTSITGYSLSNDVYIGGGAPSFFNELNPDDIESIEIVKGPSASTLYGTQAANGVIRITTKRGQAGRPRWNFFMEQGAVNDVANFPDVAFSQATGGGACYPWMQADGLCTIDQLFSHNLMEDPQMTPLKTGHRQQYGGNVSGGSDVLRYFVSADWERETGTLRLPQSEIQPLLEERGTTQLNPWEEDWNILERAGLRANLDASLGTRAELSVSSGFVSSDIQLPQTGDNLRSIYAAAMFGQADPAFPTPWGPILPRELTAHVVFRRNDRFTNSATFSYRPTDFLNVRGTAGLDFLEYSDEGFNFAGQGCTICGNQRTGIRAINQYNKSIWYGDVAATTSYQLTGSIAAKTAAGVQYTEENLTGQLSTGTTLAPGGRTVNAAAIRTTGELTTETVTIGTYVEQTLSLNDRLFLTGAVRVDQNSAFGQDSRSAAYPKGALSWVVREGSEGFLGQFRVRGAIGASGLQPGANAALRFLTPVTASLFQEEVPGVTLGDPVTGSGLGNFDLRPERSTEVEGGFDLGLFSGRVNLEATYYNKQTTDALVDRPQPGSLGGTAIRTENLAKVSNVGIELALDARIIDNTRTQWDMNLSVSGNRNRLKDLGEGVPDITGFGFANRAGFPLFGVWWEPLESFADANGDGIISPSEVVVGDSAIFLGSTVPVRTATLNTSLSLFGNRIRVGGLLDYRGGVSNVNVNDLFMCAFQQNCRQLHDPNSSLEDQAKAVAGPRAFGAYAENATFLKWREAYFTFNLPDEWAAAFRARRASITVTGRNLATITSFGTWDPEVTITTGRDDFVYNFIQAGFPRIFTARVNLGF